MEKVKKIAMTMDADEYNKLMNRNDTVNAIVELMDGLNTKGINPELLALLEELKAE